jgi:hypothetical protein
MRFRTNDKGFITLRFADFPNTEFELDEGYGDGSMTIDLVEPEPPQARQMLEYTEAERRLDEVIDQIIREYGPKPAARPRVDAERLPPMPKGR